MRFIFPKYLIKYHLINLINNNKINRMLTNTLFKHLIIKLL